MKSIVYQAQNVWTKIWFFWSDTKSVEDGLSLEETLSNAWDSVDFSEARIELCKEEFDGYIPKKKAEKLYRFYILVFDEKSGKEVSSFKLGYIVPEE